MNNENKTQTDNVVTVNKQEEIKMDKDILNVMYIPEEEKRYVLKRNGEEAEFSIERPILCMKKANATVPANRQLSDIQIQAIAENIQNKVFESTNPVLASAFRAR